MSDYEIHHVATIDEAIELAEEFRKRGRYDLFRGQVREQWKPYTSLMRLLERDQAALPAVEQKVLRFCSWLSDTPGLSEIANDEDSIIAIAQHYGIPTHYLDFTTDPAVAGFFAADTTMPDPEVESCIFCLDSEHLMSLWSAVRQDMVAAGLTEFPRLKICRPSVPNLWRLQAQYGVFLYAPTNWDFHYPMDRIVFPYTGYPSFPTKGAIYPDRKSQLEILLDQFFDNEQKREGTAELRQLFEKLKRSGANAHWVNESQHPREPYHAKYVCGGILHPHPSWEVSSSWLAITDESHSTAADREVRLSLDTALGPIEIARRVSNGVRRALERDQTLRKHLVTWRSDFATPDTAVRPALANGLKSLWDGLRTLPVKDDEIAAALGNWVALYVAQFDLAVDSRQQRLVFETVFGPSVFVEFGSHDGASSRGFASIAELSAARRSDLCELLENAALARVDDWGFLLQIITSPHHLFDFNLLARLFVTQLAPSQMVRTPPHFFSPARLGVFGLP